MLPFWKKGLDNGKAAATAAAAVEYTAPAARASLPGFSRPCIGARRFAHAYSCTAGILCRQMRVAAVAAAADSERFVCSHPRQALVAKNKGNALLSATFFFSFTFF